MSAAAPAPRRIVVLRHGRTAWNVAGRFQGRDHPEDPPLDDVGLQQAEQAGRALSGVGATLLLSSTLRRARQTAQFVSAATGLPVQPDPRLAEQAFGAWEGLTREEVEERYADQFAIWRGGGEPNREGGETRAQAGARAAEAVEDLPAGCSAILVTHGAAAASLVANLLGLGTATRRIHGLGNCHTSALRETADGWSLLSHDLPT
ncbi:histidine phosphatase family protein [Jatrophihabitans sp. YIM 134969]